MNTEFHVGNATTGLVNSVPTYCADSDHTWTYFNGSEWLHSRELLAACGSPRNTCCTAVQISSPSIINNSSHLYSEETTAALGEYSAVGMSNGRYLYQKPGMDRYLEYLPTGDWLVSDMVGSDQGFISHVGGSICAEDTENKWEVSVWDKKTEEWHWAYDTLLEVKCSEQTHTKEKERPRATGSQKMVLFDPEVVDKTDRTVITVLAVLSFILFLFLTAIFIRRFHRAWSKGAHGKQLLLQSLDI